MEPIQVPECSWQLSYPSRCDAPEIGGTAAPLSVFIGWRRQAVRRPNGLGWSEQPILRHELPWAVTCFRHGGGVANLRVTVDSESPSRAAAEASAMMCPGVNDSES